MILHVFITLHCYECDLPLLHMCVSQIGQCVWVSCAIMLSLQILFRAVYVFWFCDNPLASLSYWILLLFFSERMHGVLSLWKLFTVITFCDWIHCLLVLFALLVCLTDRFSLLWTIISIVIRLAFRKTTCLRIFWPCTAFDPSFVSPAYPLWKQPAEPAPDLTGFRCRQVKATPSLKPTQSLRSQSAIQVPQEEGCLLMCFKRHDWF